MRLRWGILLGALAGLCLLMQTALVSAATDSGVYVEFRESDSPDAPVVERWKLYGSSYALVIGIDTYTSGWPRLVNAVKDATLVAAELARQGFEVELLTNVTGAQLREDLRRFFAIKGNDPSSRLFLWFAGHGYTENGEGYLVPADAPAPEAAEFRLIALHLGDVGSMVKIARSKHVLAVFDSCFAGTIFGSQRARPPAAITAAVKSPVRQFLTSGAADQQVSDDGTFRELFLRALRGEEIADANRDGYLTGTELSLYLQDRIINLTQGAQTPQGGKLRDPRFDQGDFVFLLPGARTNAQVTAQGSGIAPAPSVPSRADLDVTFWNSIKDSENPADFQAYLKTFTEGSFRSLAEVRLDAAQKKAQQQATTPPAETAVAALSAARFDGKWKWHSVDLTGPCSSATFKKFVVKGGSIKASGRHPMIGNIPITGKVDDQGVVSLVGAKSGVLLRFKGRMTESEGSGTVDMTGAENCSGRWSVTRVGTN